VIDSLKLAGTQTALVHLVEGLARCGYQQRVYTLNPQVDPGIGRALRQNGAVILSLGKVQAVTGVGLLRLWRDFRRWRPDAVQTFLPFADTLGRTAARLAGVPAIVSSIRARNIEKKRWQLWFDRLTVRWADRVVFNTRQAIPFALENEGVREGQVVYIPNGVREVWVEPGARGAARAAWGAGPDTRVLGTVGRLTWQKGHAALLDAFARLPKRDPLRLILVGDGEQRPSLEAQARTLGISADVRFLGEQRETPSLLAGFDLYVHPSIYEGMSNALMEAMAAGKPCIATRVDGALELITHGETGWLVPPSDPAALAGQIAGVLADREAATRVGQAAAAHMAARFSQARMVAAFDALYRALCRAPSG